MKSTNTKSSSRQSAATSRGPGSLSRYIIAGLMAALILAIFLAPSFQAPPTAEAQANNATGTPGIRDSAHPLDTLTTVRPGMTLTVDTTGIMDADGITMVDWIYQWAYFDGTDVTDIAGSTEITYLLEEKDIDKAMVVKVSFTDDLSNPEGPILSTQTQFVGPRNLIVSNAGNDTLYDINLALTATTTKLAQSFTSRDDAATYALDFIELSFGNIGDTTTIADGIAVTLNADSSGDPGTVLCTLENPPTFASSGAHNFYAPHSGVSTLCPPLVASTNYHVVIEKDSSYTSSLSLTHYTFKITNRESAFNWSIPNEAQSYTSSAWTDNADDFPMLIDVRARLTEFELEELTETEVPLTSDLIPGSLSGTNKFRLLFLTDAEKPTSDDIDIYNAFVQAQAAGGITALQEYATHFRVLGSTAAVDARDNTETTYTAMNPGVPVFWLEGGKLADDYQDLYDGSWDQQAGGKDRFADNGQGNVWTGSATDGTEYFLSSVSQALGAATVRQGRIGSSPNPLSKSSAGPTTEEPFYALSGVFTVPNQSATGNVAITKVNPSTPRVNDVLTANTSGITDGNGTDRAVFTYVWFRDNIAITDATGATYKPTEEDLDQTLKVTVTMTDNHGFDEGSFTSATTDAVLPQYFRVRNLGSGTVSIEPNATNPIATQSFTTGPGRGGYRLDSVGFRMLVIDDPASAGNDIEVTINERLSSGEPGAALCTLQDPATFTAQAINRFKAATPEACPELDPVTTYFAVFHRVAFTGGHSIQFRSGLGTGEDLISEPKWSIPEPGYNFNTINGWVQGQFYHQIEINADDGLEINAPQGWSLTPTGLIGGEGFRLMFVSANGFSPTETDIEKYNAYVQSQINLPDAPEDIRPYSAWFRVLGSTQDVDARDNTRTNPNEYTSVPIYWMGGAKIADNYGDLYDGSWDNETHVRSNGASGTTQINVWTGSENNGTESFTSGTSNALGTSDVRRGTLRGIGDPLKSFVSPAGTIYGYYALSGIFIAPNNDATGQPAITGTPRVGQTLSVDTSPITDTEGTNNATFTYQWIRVDDNDETDINGATRSTYEPTDQDADKHLRVRVSFTDDQGFPEGPLVSEPTFLIAGRDLLVRNIGQPANNVSYFVGLNNTTGRIAQSFRTGFNADGYIVTSFAFSFSAIPDPGDAGSEITATLNAESSSRPGSILCTLTNPTSFPSSGLVTFTAPTAESDLCPELSVNTTYYAVLQRQTTNSVSMIARVTNAADEDPGSTSDWFISNKRFRRTSSWASASNRSFLLEVKGQAATPAIITDHRAWVDNRQGSTDTGYDNTGDYIIAQGFRTGDTAGIYDVHEIHVDFERGQPATDTITVKIVESTAPDDKWEHATPFHFERGGVYPALPVPTGGVLSFSRSEGNSALKANTNYFLIVESTSVDAANAAVVQMTESEGQTSDDGWTVDDYSHTKTREDSATWTRQDHQLRFRISGEYRDGIGMPGDSYGFESCVEVRRGESASCVLAVAVPAPADPDNPPENVSKSSLALDLTRFTEIAEWWTGWWEKTPQTISFPVTMRPLPTGSNYVTIHYGTQGHTALSGHDYWNAQGTVRFDSNSNHTQIVKVQVLDDGIEDSGETFSFFLYRCMDDEGDSCEDQFTDDSGVDGIIYNTEESAEIAYLQVSDVTVTEGEEATAVFTVSLTQPTTAAVYFEYTTQDGTAVDGVHYTGGSGTAFLANGDTSVTISVPVSNDEVWTGDRSFTLNISEAVHAAIADASGAATIKDDEPKPLTARFTNIPEGNHGETSFGFNISFNQDVSTQYLVMQNDALTVTNGEVTRAERINGNRDFWRITVEPESGADVTVHLPATESCADTGAVCTRGDNATPLTTSVTHTFPGTQLNAKLEGVDSHHDGSTTFKFTVVFSEEVDTTATEIGDHALTITGGTFTKVVQKDDGSTRRWEITVKPGGIDDIEISIRAATDCDTDGNICTSEGELLSKRTTDHSIGPELISVSDATVHEGDGAELVFTLSIPEFWFGHDITVDYATSDGTATADDYTPTSGTLNFRWRKSMTVTVPVLTDSLTEGAETMTLTISNAVNAVIADAEGAGTIEDPEPAEEETTVNAAPNGLPTVSGTPQVDQRLTADVSGITDPDGLTNPGFTYQWSAGGADIPGATSSSYFLTGSEHGKTVQVQVSFTDDGENEESVTSIATETVAGRPASTVWKADMQVVKYTDTNIGAASADLFSNVGGAGGLAIRSLWSSLPDRDLRLAFAEGVADADDMTLHVGGLALEFPEGSSGNGSFKWTEVDVDWEDGETIAVRIDTTSPPTDAESQNEPEAEEPTPNTAPNGLPTISGTPQVGQTLTADTSGISDAEGLTNVSYQHQWLAGGTDISGATGSSYLLTTTEQGQTIQVQVTFTDDADNQESLTSAETLAVAAKPNTAAAGEPTISGTPQVDETLTASTSGISDDDGLTNVSYQYQWLAGGTEISGATGSSRLLTASELGQTVQVKVTFNDDAGNAESLTSAATTAVSARPTPAVLLTASFANVPADHNGSNFTFDLNFSENVEAGYARVRDHAFTLNGATIASASRMTQGSNQGWNVEVDPAGNEAITITLPETTDCSDSGAICTDDERKLSHPTSVRVAGPPSISVGDATVQEAEGAVLVFTVTLSHPSSRTVTVSYATSDGTATAGSDYTAASGSLTFNTGDLSQTVPVTVLTDSDEEGQETMTLTLSNASSATLADATGAGAILNGESTATQDDPPAEDPVVDDPVILLTASFSNMPATHDGTSFTFELDFSENVEAGYARIRDHAFTINGAADIISAVRKVQGSNQGWTITVNPDGSADITITLPPTTDCDATGAICTDDERMLSSSEEAQVTGPE